MPRGGQRLRLPTGKLNGIGRRAAARRSELELEQDEVCAQIAYVTDGGWNPGWQDISKVERGVRMVSDLEVRVLARVLGCRPGWLLTGEEPMSGVTMGKPGEW